jgi:8-oxo-dGTP diphosphatase
VEVSVAVGALCRDGRILLGKRAAHRVAYPGVWDLPGGHVEAGETIERALMRELQEELGVTPTEWRKLALLHAQAMPTEPPSMLRVHIFLVTTWRGEPRNLLPSEHDEIAWMAITEASTLELAHPGYLALFREALEATP